MSRAKPKEVKAELSRSTRAANTPTPVTTSGFAAGATATTSSSLFGGCYCGGGQLHLDASSPRSSKPQEEDEEEQEQEHGRQEGMPTATATACDMRTCVGGGGGGGCGNVRPLSAIETMMRLRHHGRSRDHSSSLSMRHGDTNTTDATVTETEFHCDTANMERSGVADLLASLGRTEVREEEEDEEENEEEEEGEGGNSKQSSGLFPPPAPPPLYFTCPVTGITVDVSVLRAVFIV